MDLKKKFRKEERREDSYYFYIFFFSVFGRWVVVDASGAHEEPAFGSAGFDLLEDDAMEVDVITLGPGDTFGREALPPPLSLGTACLRRHSCISGATTEVIVVDHNEFLRARDQGRKEMTFEQKVQCLRHAALLRDCGDAEYTVVASPPMSKVCANSVLKNYQCVFSNDAGHTMTNSTSIDLPRHWFGAGAQVR